LETTLNAYKSAEDGSCKRLCNYCVE